MCNKVCSFVFCFFFFKQKTAYEMRISDWSSDVCSSDLQHRRARPVPGPSDHQRDGRRPHHHQEPAARALRGQDHQDVAQARRLVLARHAEPRRLAEGGRAHRSEEHTSELQSLMRNSYAVFCLKKKKYTRNNKQDTRRSKTTL